ncbi:MAG: HprK-related kinase B [Humidesulfovibrio sp.]|nr:HprK-related kinase B [Humidesulfovibrio sp.]
MSAQSGGPAAFDTLARVLAERESAPYAFRLRLEELTLSVRSNSGAVINDLRGYFAPFAATEESAPADLDFLLLDSPVEVPPMELATRPHLPGKRPDKERTADLPGADGGGRIVRKQATGMLFVFGGRGVNIALGPCALNRNQLVNFLCARYMERRVARGWVLGHAAGVARPQALGGKALALCGFAGMGKSTLALHLVARGCDFLSNDRVLVEPRPGQAPVLHGIPKHPRLNPGTALGNPELSPLLACALPEALRRAYADLPTAALYAVEDKYDAVIDECFGTRSSGGTAGDSRFRLAAPLAGLVVLNWRHGGGSLSARRVDLALRPDLLEALRKPPGAFYLDTALKTARLTAADCLEALSGVPALELSGGSDFSAGATACLDFFDEEQAQGREP